MFKVVDTLKMKMHFIVPFSRVGMEHKLIIVSA